MAARPARQRICPALAHLPEPVSAPEPEPPSAETTQAQVGPGRMRFLPSSAQVQAATLQRPLAFPALRRRQPPEPRRSLGIQRASMHAVSRAAPETELLQSHSLAPEPARRLPAWRSADARPVRANRTATMTATPVPA